MKYDHDNGHDAETLKASNLAWFKKEFYYIYQQIVACSPISELVDEGDGWYNIEFRGQKLYLPTAKEYIENQLENFRISPQRMLMPPPQPQVFDLYAGNFLHSFIQRASDSSIEFLASIPYPKSYYTFVFGFGLGKHVLELLEVTECQYLIIVEPNLEFIVHSLEVFDWQKLSDTLSGCGGNMDIVLSGNPDAVFAQFKRDIRITNPCSLDGAIIFFNYNNDVFSVIDARLKKDANLILSGLGFYFDETVMIANTHKNLSAGDASMIRFDKDKMRGCPAIIVASGPSLDKDIEWLKENQGKAVVFACGSAIMPLLRNGILPDFTVEIENIPELYPMMLDTVKYVDVSKVHLLATTTIDPRVPGFFDKTSYFFRPALSSYPIFARDGDEPLHNGSPTVTNAAVALAQNFGFREMYLFGTDMGSKIEGQAHSKHAWQNTDEGCEVDIKFNSPVRGNFGGTVYSYPDMNWTRSELELALSGFHRGRQYYNCSDGAYIKGTLAKHSRSVKLNVNPGVKLREAKNIADLFKPYSRADFEVRWNDDTVRAGIEEYCDSLSECFDDLAEAKSKRAMTNVNKLLVAYNATGLDMALAMIFRGSVWQALLAGDFYFNRANVEENDDSSAKFFCGEIQRLIRHLKHLAVEDIGRLSEQAWEPRDRLLSFPREEWD